MALAKKQLLPYQVNVISVHGTGTPLGDPIEVGALSQAIAAGPIMPNTNSTVSLLSSKACYGHTEGTAGITGLFLSTQAMRHEQISAVLHLRNMNPHVGSAIRDWGHSPRGTKSLAYLPRQVGPNPGHSHSAMLFGTSSFGMSGVNAHMLISSAKLLGDRSQVR
jgi:acyl transferase domain-containing protein